VIATLHREQVIPAELDAVWQFFATPRNLSRLTPSNVKLRIVSPIPERLYAGHLIQYRISLLPGLWSSWITEIRQLRQFEYFADEQLIGPYKLWFHEHHFEPVAGGVKMIDHVTYAVGYGPLGWLLHKLWIRPKLNAIFDFRRQAIESIFAPVEKGTQ
jgi:ligand-binding SRPBCC domain-containing protein